MPGRRLEKALVSLTVCTLACVSPRTHFPSLTTSKLALPDLSGQRRPLGAFMGHVVLIEFFATWCEPCRILLATCNAWQREHRDEGLVVIAVSLDENGASVLDFARRYAPDLLVLLDSELTYASHLKVRTIPAAYLFDRAGNLVSRHEAAAPASLKAEITMLLQKP